MPTRLLLEGPDIETLLERVREEHGTDARIVHADKVRSGGIGGFFSKERYEVAVEVPGSRETAQPEDRVPAGAPASAPQPAGSDLSVVVTSPPEADAGARPALLDLAAAVDAAESADFAAALARVTASGRAGGTDAPPTARGFVPAPCPPVATVVARAPVRAVRSPLSLGARLLALGLPEEIAAEVELGDPDGLTAALTRALSVLPQPDAPSTAPGHVVAVVGEAPAAYAVARAMARTMRLDPDAVLLAAPSRMGTGVSSPPLSGPASARRAGARLHRSDVATLVAVDAPVDGEAARWARDVVDALGAAEVWALVDATRKPADLADHLDALGEVRSLVVHGTAATRDPASVLGLARARALPTGLVEGRRGDARAWACLLSERLESLHGPRRAPGDDRGPR